MKKAAAVLMIALAGALGGCQTTRTTADGEKVDKDVVIIPLTSEVKVGRVQTDVSMCSESAFMSGMKEDMRKGVEICTRAINAGNLSRKDLAGAYYNRGYLLFSLQDFKAAEADFSRAIDLELVQLHKAYYARGLCKQNTGRTRAAADDYSKALEIKPDWSMAKRKRREFWWVYGDENPYENN